MKFIALPGCRQNETDVNPANEDNVVTTLVAAKSSCSLTHFYPWKLSYILCLGDFKEKVGVKK